MQVWACVPSTTITEQYTIPHPATPSIAVTQREGVFSMGGS